MTPGFATRFRVEALLHHEVPQNAPDAEAFLIYAKHLLAHYFTYDGIANAYETSQPNVSQLFKRIGFTQNNRLTDIQKAKIESMHANGYKVKTIIGQDVLRGVKETTVRQFIRRHCK